MERISEAIEAVDASCDSPPYQDVSDTQSLRLAWTDRPDGARTCCEVRLIWIHERVLIQPLPNCPIESALTLDRLVCNNN
jgi:hypothetical protein